MTAEERSVLVANEALRAANELFGVLAPENVEAFVGAMNSNAYIYGHSQDWGIVAWDSFLKIFCELKWESDAHA